ncbi:MAG TPA: cyclic nucleotide-binding domain-containing protein [Polyangiaceae bacterium]|nr:cyclic nucleotide-binding domain-containing protein [Polyangiaceae bacterium]
MNEDLQIVPTVASGVRDRLLAVRTLGILDGLDDDAALLLAEYSKVTTFEPEQEVTSANQEPDSAYIVLEGRLSVPRPRGAPMVIDSGRGVGVLGILSSQGKGLRSVAEVKTRTLEIPKDVFFAALDESFSIARNLLKVLAGMLLDVRGPLPSDEEALPAEPAIEDRMATRTLVERVIELSRTGIFIGANLDPIFDVARIMGQVRVPSGHVFFSAGDKSRTIIRVLAGTILCTAPDGSNVEIGPGHMLGGLQAIAGRRHTFEARATVETVAYEIDFEDFLVVLEAHPDLTMKLLRTFATRVIEEG